MTTPPRREVVTVAESHACSQLVIGASKMPTGGDRGAIRLPDY